jgi:hypothetical protein
MLEPLYKYTLNQCDVPNDRRPQLKRYREQRAKWIEMLRGSNAASVTHQLHDLAWDTAVFQTLNEARRIEPDRPVNGPLWDLLTNGYVSRMVLGIRRLVDHVDSTTGLHSILSNVRKHHVLMTRENYVCHDALPFDPRPARDKFYEENRLELGETGAFWLKNEGPESFATSERRHETFDRLCESSPATGSRDERISLEVLDRLEASLKSPEIKHVRLLANKRFAHSARMTRRAEERLRLTFNDLEVALQQIAGVANFLSANVFFDAAFGSVVPTPQFDQLEHLDQSWALTDNLAALRSHWENLGARMNDAAFPDELQFLPAWHKRPTIFSPARGLA